MRGRHILFITVFCLLSRGLCAQEFKARVIDVAEGDTITVLKPARSAEEDPQAIKIRLFGIDCPEKSQAFASNAKRLTSKLCFDKTVTVKSKGQDRWTIAEVILPDGKNLGHELLRAGLAWRYAKHSNDATLARLQNEAREAKLGLWANNNATPPWEFRKKQRNGADLREPEDNDKPWSKTIYAREGTTPLMAIVKDHSCRKRRAGQSVGKSAGALFASDLIMLPEPGRYRATFRLRLLREEKYSNYQTRVLLRIHDKDTQNMGDKNAKSIRTLLLLPSAISKRYEPYHVEFEVDGKTAFIRAVVWQVGVFLRFDHVRIAFLRDLPERKANEGSMKKPPDKVAPPPQDGPPKKTNADKTPKYEIVAKEDQSYSRVVRLTFRVRVDKKKTRQELEAISQGIIKRNRAANAVMILFYLPGTSTSGHYTAGRAVWAPSGEWGRAGDVTTGELSKHKLVIDVGNRLGEVKPSQVVKAVPELKRQEIFRAVVKAQDSGVGDEKAYHIVAKRYGLGVPAIRKIVLEGATKGWPFE